MMPKEKQMAPVQQPFHIRSTQLGINLVHTMTFLCRRKRILSGPSARLDSLILPGPISGGGQRRDQQPLFVSESWLQVIGVGFHTGPRVGGVPIRHQKFPFDPEYEPKVKGI